MQHEVILILNSTTVKAEFNVTVFRLGLASWLEHYLCFTYTKYVACIDVFSLCSVELAILMLNSTTVEAEFIVTVNSGEDMQILCHIVAYYYLVEAIDNDSNIHYYM